MASAPLPPGSNKETTNFARLCRLLVDVGSQALRQTFDKIHPPASLHKVLLSPPVHATLQQLYTGRKKVLNPTQWGKLYPAHAPVSSAGFDITLLTVLLRNICGLNTPAAGWDSLPAETDKNPEDDIARVKYYRNTLYGHASQVSIDDASFNAYWQEIREALIRLGGQSFGAVIDNLKIECMDPDSEEHYRKLLEQWKKDDDSIKDRLEEMEDNIRDKLEQMRSELENSIKGTLEQMKEIKDILTVPAGGSKDEGKIRGDLEAMKSEVGNIGEKLDSFSEDDIRGKLGQMKIEMNNIKEKLETLRAGSEKARVEGAFHPSEVIDAIRQLYKNREGWLAPFPWCEEFHFHLSDVFTRLKMVKKKKTRGTSTSEGVEMSAIFQPHEECPKPRTVLIEGNPGMGKTTYCNKLAYDWAVEEGETEASFPKFQVVLSLKCRDITSDIWEAFDDQLLPRDIQEQDREKFFEFIRRNQSSVLLILDGLDELPTSKLPAFSEIMQGRVLSRCHLVVTARHEAGITVRKFCDTLLEIEGFTEKDAKDFIAKYFKTVTELGEKLLRKLRNDRSLKDLMRNPLNTALLCLLCEDFQGVFPESRTQLFLEIVQCVLRRYRRKQGLPEISDDLIEVYKTQLIQLGSIALNGLLEDKMYFEGKKINHQTSDLPGFGFLSVQPGSSKRRPCLQYGFLHKSFQEVFAAYYICCQLLSKEISPESLVADTRYFHELRQVLFFTCGMLAVQSEETAVALIKSMATQVKSRGDLYLALGCIKESKKEENNLHVELARVFGSFLTLESCMFDMGVLDDVRVVELSEAISVNTSLTKLNLTVNKISHATALAEALKVNATLELLSLLGSVHDDGAAALAEALITNSTLRELHLCDPNIGVPGVAALAEALKTNTTLAQLHLLGAVTEMPILLRGILIGAEGAAALAEVLKVNTTLKKLYLRSDNIGATGAAAIAEAITSNTTLTELLLPDNNINDAGAVALAEALKTNTTLTDLYLNNNCIGSSGAVALAEALNSNTALTQLYLNNNNVGAAGAAALAQSLKTNTSLRELYLYNNNINAVGIAALTEARESNSTLTKLYFS